MIWSVIGNQIKIHTPQNLSSGETPDVHYNASITLLGWLTVKCRSGSVQGMQDNQIMKTRWNRRETHNGIKHTTALVCLIDSIVWFSLKHRMSTRPARVEVWGSDRCAQKLGTVLKKNPAGSGNCFTNRVEAEAVSTKSVRQHIPAVRWSSVEDKPTPCLTHRGELESNPVSWVKLHTTHRNTAACQVLHARSFFSF